MLKKLHSLQQNDLFRGTAVIFLGSIFAGFGNYIFNILMGRMLGPTQYGILASLLALTYIVGVPSQTINLVVSKYIAMLHAKNQINQAREFLKKILSKTMVWGMIFLVLFYLSSFFIADFLHLQSPSPLFILGLILLFSFISPVFDGSLAGLTKFKELSLNSVLTVFLKLALAIFLIYGGFGVNGSLLAILTSSLFAIVFAFYWLKLPREQSPLKINTSHFLNYGKNVFFASFFLAALYNIDILLVKHFFSPQEAGYYATLSLLGKMIFFLTASVSAVLFPLSAKNHEKGESSAHLLKLSVLVVLLFSLFITTAYFLFPALIVNALFGALYLPIAPYLGYIGIVFIFYSLINVLILYNLSINRFDFVICLFLGTFCEIGLIYLFHSSLQQIIEIMLVVMGLTFFSIILLLIIKKPILKFRA